MVDLDEIYGQKADMDNRGAPAGEAMDQPVPKYAEGDLDRIIARDYPKEARAEVERALAAYAGESSPSGALRVRMACLKLADGDLEKLKRFVLDACRDYRDVLAWAEYLSYFHAPGDEERAAAIERDWRELQAWYARK
jgi:hypothetical protein